MRDMGQITVGNPQICAPWQFDGRNATIAGTDGRAPGSQHLSEIIEWRMLFSANPWPPRIESGAGVRPNHAPLSLTAAG
jgi:hypothetical protein